ncbi:MAG: hypothetical protein IT257_11805, partial [Chitinophagaceae bacterium]|nr:hypothetical protein [Chitinophagaceae bacterium]
MLTILSYCYSKAQPVCIEKIKPENGANSFTAVYAMLQDADGIIYLATDKGLFYYAGNIIQYYKNAATNYLDIINLYKDKNQTIWALPYHGKIFSVSNNKTQGRELRFFGDDNYKAYYAFTDEAGDLHFQVSYQNESYVATLTKSAQLVTQHIRSHPAGFASYYFKSKQLPIPYAEQLTANVVGRTTQEIRFFNDEYFTLKNSILLIRNGQADTIFDGNQYGLQASAIVQFVINNSNDMYIALVGPKKGLYHYNGKTLEPIYTTEGANSILKDPYGNYYFTDLSNRLLIIRPHQIRKLSLPADEHFQIKKIYSLRETDSLVMQSSNGSAYYYDLTNKSMRLIEKNLHQENSNKLLECNEQLALLSSDQLHFYKPDRRYALKLKPMANYSNIQLDLYQHNNNLFLFLKNYCMSYDLIYNTSTFQGFKFKLNTIKTHNDQQLLLFTDKGNYTFQLDTPNQINKLPDQHQADSADILKYTDIGDTEYFLTPDKILRKKKNEKNGYTLEFSSVLNNFNCYALDFFAANEYLIFIKQKHIDFYNTITKQYYSYKVPYLEDEELISGGFSKQQSIYFYSKQNIYSLPFDFLNYSKQIPALIISEGLYNGGNIHE